MKQEIFRGIATALATPMELDGAIDYEAYGRLIDWQIDAGVAGLVACGTTGESATMTEAEHKEVIRFTVERAAGRVPVIAGTGSNCTAKAVAMTQYACSVGADACLLVTPYYNKATQAGLIAHYTAIADAVSCPVICYNVPSRTGVDMTLETYQALSKHPNIQGVKEAGGSPAKIAKTIETCADDFFVWSGNDDEAVGTMALGAKGLISVLSNVRPKKTLAMIRACQQNDFRCAGALQRELMELIGALFCVVNPIPVKKALELEGIPVGDPRLPLTAFPAEKLPLLKAALAKTPDA